MSQGGCEFLASGHTSAPVLCTVIDMQDFEGFCFHRIHDDVREWAKRQLSGTAAMALPAPVWRLFQKSDLVVDLPDRGLCELRMVLL